MAYEAREGGKSFAVVDGKEGKGYDALLENSLIFSPDSKRVDYGDGEDGKEERQYDNILYLAEKNKRIYLVEERIE